MDDVETVDVLNHEVAQSQDVGSDGSKVKGGHEGKDDNQQAIHVHHNVGMSTRTGVRLRVESSHWGQLSGAVSRRRTCEYEMD